MNEHKISQRMKDKYFNKTRYFNLFSKQNVLMTLLKHSLVCKLKMQITSRKGLKKLNNKIFCIYKHILHEVSEKFYYLNDKTLKKN